MLCHLIEIRAVCWNPDPAARVQGLKPIPAGYHKVRDVGLDLDVVKNKDRRNTGHELEVPHCKHHIVCCLILNCALCFLVLLGLQERKSDMANATDGEEWEEWALEALRGTQPVNPRLRMPYNRGITLVLSGGVSYGLGMKEPKLQLYFKLQCTAAGRQHYKLCTPRALRRASDLYCPFCSYDVLMWRVAGKKLIVPNELPFIRMVVDNGVCVNWCHQVRLRFWRGLVDFYNRQLGVCVQIDGHTHWQGMHIHHHTKASQRDFDCNKAAFDAHVALVRVHEADLTHRDCVFAAINVAAACKAVVLTASYHNIGWQQQGIRVSYGCLLQQHFGSKSCCYIDPYCNTVIRNNTPLTM